MAATWPSQRFHMAKAGWRPRGSGQGRVIFSASELVEDITMETLSWTLTAFCAPAAWQTADAVPTIRGLGVSTTNQSFFRNLISAGRESGCSADHGACALFWLVRLIGGERLIPCPQPQYPARRDFLCRRYGSLRPHVGFRR